MAELTLVPPEPKTTKTGGATPYKGTSHRFLGNTPPLGAQRAHQEPEPEIQTGINLAGKTKIVFAAGLG